MQHIFQVLDLFSGIGGFSLGLERTGGFKTVAFCEINEFCREVLNQHWPDIPVYDDVRGLTAARLGADGVHPDVITGGFPCQDISLAGKGAGLSGERSGLWFEFRRLIAEICPAWVIIENVSALRSRGLDAVLGSLAEIGYDAEWHCIPAAAVGAPHRRDRIWIVAYPAGQPEPEPRHQAKTISDQRDARLDLSGGCSRQPDRTPDQNVAYTDESRLQRRLRAILSECSRERAIGESGSSIGCAADHWLVEPDVGRVADGVPNRVDRLRSLGNALVPQIPEIIGRTIIASHGAAPG